MSPRAPVFEPRYLLLRITWLNWLLSLVSWLSFPAVCMYVADEAWTGFVDSPLLTGWRPWDHQARIWLPLVLAVWVPAVFHRYLRAGLAPPVRRERKMPGRDRVGYRSRPETRTVLDSRAWARYLHAFGWRVVGAMMFGAWAWHGLLKNRTFHDGGTGTWAGCCSVGENVTYVAFMLVVLLRHMPTPRRVFGSSITQASLFERMSFRAELGQGYRGARHWRMSVQLGFRAIHWKAVFSTGGSVLAWGGLVWIACVLFELGRWTAAGRGLTGFALVLLVPEALRAAKKDWRIRLSQTLSFVAPCLALVSFASALPGTCCFCDHSPGAQALRVVESLGEFGLFPAFALLMAALLLALSYRPSASRTERLALRRTTTVVLGTAACLGAFVFVMAQMLIVLLSPPDTLMPYAKPYDGSVLTWIAWIGVLLGYACAVVVVGLERWRKTSRRGARSHANGFSRSPSVLLSRT